MRRQGSQAKYVTPLRSQGGDGCEETFDETRPTVTPRAIASVALENTWPECPLRVVVGRFITTDVCEGPRLAGAVDEIVGEARDPLEAAERAGDEQSCAVPR